MADDTGLFTRSVGEKSGGEAIGGEPTSSGEGVNGTPGRVVVDRERVRGIGVTSTGVPASPSANGVVAAIRATKTVVGRRGFRRRHSAPPRAAR